MEGITADEYKRAQEMWSTYKCENMQDFHNVYVKLDVVLWADCMEKIFSELAFKNIESIQHTVGC